MLRKTHWKTAAKYAAGITVLAIAIAIALALPQWYGSWQDEQMMGTVYLESRENIAFMDTDTLDIAGRMKLLAEAETLEWEEYEYAGILLEKMHTEQLLDTLSTQLTKWSQCGLIPQDVLHWIHEDYGALATMAYVYADQTVFQVITYVFVYDDNCLLVIADANIDLVYCVACLGDLGEQHLASIFGYSDVEEMASMLEQGIMPEVQQDENSCNFAEVCGAQSAVVRAGVGLAELDAELKFENFTGMACRRILDSEFGAGFAVELGTDKWQNVISMFSKAYGLWITQIDLYQQLADIWMELGITAYDAAAYANEEEIIYEEEQYVVVTEPAEVEKTNAENVAVAEY